MRHSVLAAALAAVSVVFSVPGHAGTSYAESREDRQTCVTKRIQAEDQAGRAVSKRVRICQ